VEFKPKIDIIPGSPISNGALSIPSAQVIYKVEPLEACKLKATTFCMDKEYVLLQS
jgi:hypothetical protein